MSKNYEVRAAEEHSDGELHGSGPVLFEGHNMESARAFIKRETDKATEEASGGLVLIGFEIEAVTYKKGREVKREILA